MKYKICIAILLFAIVFVSGCNAEHIQESTSSSPDTISTSSNEVSDTVSFEEEKTSSITSKTTTSSESSRTEPKINKITVVSSEPYSEPESEPQEESKKEGKEVHIGDKITTDYGEMSIESYKISKKFDYTRKDYDGNTIPLSLDAKEGKTYLIFTGIYKNTSGDKLCPDIIDEGAIVNDQYEYSYSFWEDDILAGLGITYQGGLDPLESNRYYGLLEVPDEAMNKLTKCELTFRFCGGKSYGYSGETYRLIITR